MRGLLILIAFGLLALAWSQTAPAPEAPDYALSLPKQSDATFWASHRGLGEVNLEGPVGVGDMARLLMRRRSNAPLIRPLRDRFFFTSRDFRDFRTPDVLGAVLTEKGLNWTNRPAPVILTAGQVFNLPLIVESQVPVAAKIVVAVDGDVEKSGFSAPNLAPKTSNGYLLRLKAERPGRARAHITLSAAGIGKELDLPLDVRPKATLRINLEDEAGAKASSRVYLTAADGLAYAPSGTIHRIGAMPAESYFYSDGSFSVDVPAGPTVIEAVRGLEYELAKREITLVPGDNPPVRIRLKRWAAMRREGWYSTDSHIHGNYVAPHHQSITPEDVRLQVEAEDLNVANMVIGNSYTDFIHDQALFEGRPHALSSRNHILYWNEEMRGGSSFGHMCFFNLKSLVHPLYTGQPNSPHWEDYPPNYTQAKQAREQGGAVTYAHPGYLAGFAEYNAKELPVDIALGQVDGMDVLSNAYETAGEAIYHRLLNCGFRLTASAGTDSFTNLTDHYIPGGGRAYVRVDGPFDYASWIRGFKAGNSFVTNGPMVTLDVQGRGPGQELELRAGTTTSLDVKVSVSSLVPIDKVEVLVNGKSVITRNANGGTRVTLRESISVQRSSWIAARVEGPWSRLVVNDSGAYAHTSPVYVRVGGEPVAIKEDLRFFVLWIEQLIAKVRSQGKFATPERRDEVVRLFSEALEIYRRREAAAR